MYGTIQAKPHYGYSSVNIKSAEGKFEMQRNRKIRHYFNFVCGGSGGSLSHLILSLVPLYPHRLSTCWNLLMLHSSPLRQQRGLSMYSTRGLGFTVKCKNRFTTSRSNNIPDWAGPVAQERISNWFLWFDSIRNMTNKSVLQ